MTILVTDCNGQLGNEMRIVTTGSKYRYVFTNVCNEHPKSLEKLYKQGDLERLCDIQPCYSDELSSLVKHPAFSVLDKSKVSFFHLSLIN